MKLPRWYRDQIRRDRQQAAYDEVAKRRYGGFRRRYLPGVYPAWGPSMDEAFAAHEDGWAEMYRRRAAMLEPAVGQTIRLAMDPASGDEHVVVAWGESVLPTMIVKAGELQRYAEHHKILDRLDLKDRDA